MLSSSRLAVCLATLAFVVSQANLGYLLHQLRPNILVLQSTFDADAYWAILRAWGDAGVARYRAHFPYDLLHPFVYALFGWVLACRAGLFAAGERRAMTRAAWMLPVAGLFDQAENLCQLRLLAGPFGAPSVLIPLSALCSSIKWGLAVLFAVTMARRVLQISARNGRLSQ